LEPSYEGNEERLSSAGATNSGRWLVLVTTLRDDKIRVVTAYEAPKHLVAMCLRQKGGI
jgi:uncharacterized DUF497 family protein